MERVAALVPESSVRRATAELLWAAASPFPDRTLVAERSRADHDGELLATAAVEQWVAPLVWRSLSDAGSDALLPPEAAVRLRAQAARWGAKSHYLPGALERAIPPLMSAGLEPVVFKGAALADRYPDPALRPMGDIDVIVPRRAHTTALAALARSGWTVGIPLDRLRHETVLVHPECPTLTLEVHVALERWHDRLTRLDSDELWRRRRPATLLGTPAFVLAPEDEVIVLAAHAGKPFHCFDRLMWFADLAVAIGAARRHGGIDWAVVVSRARSLRATTILAVALRQASRLGADVPPAAMGTLPGRGWRHAVLAPLVTAEWPLEPPDAVTRRRARYALSETWARRVQLFFGESPYEPLWRQPLKIGNRARLALFGLPRVNRTGGG